MSAQADQIISDLGQGEEPAPLAIEPAPHDTHDLRGNRVGIERGRLVPVFEPGIDPDEVCYSERDCEMHDLRKATVRQLLQFLTLGEGSVNRVGWRAIALFRELDKSESQSALAARLGVSEAAVSKSVKSMNAEITAFFREISSPN